MQAPLDKDRRFLGFTVFDSCYLDENGVIYNNSNNAPFYYSWTMGIYQFGY